MSNSQIVSLWTNADNSLHAKFSDGGEKCIAHFTNERNRSCFDDLLKDLKKMLRLD